MEIGEKLKSLRKENGLTQTELAKKLNIGQTTVAAYENGTHEPQIFSLIAYADYFGCTVDFLVGRDEDYIRTDIRREQPLTEEERRLIVLYRSLNEDMRDMLMKQVQVMKDSRLNKG